MKIKVLLADDHQIMRDGLASLLEKHPDLEVVAQAGEGRAAVSLAREFHPDVVIMDIAMPGLNGIEATRQIVAAAPGVKVIALSVHAEGPFVAGMLQAGASGYLLKHSAAEELVRAIRLVVQGQTYLSPQITGQVVEGYMGKRSPAGASVFTVLSPREREVLQLYAEGKITRQIAALLNISPKTVEFHRRQIMDKTGSASFADLVKYAIREGLAT
ncbi:MAG: response regulator transcription factor [Proteobacteria bacterium]|nr:response regulator transcription factor [Pseudomonadota bacterium]MBU4354302.1 response regulator transcription factor [Pseudomonadota bacterium]MBU4447925.1 response regulator transcription factor [Pseudomonadota bacterium]MCG2770911.1 response regulator transcription factor [Desulfobacterales bacterium]